MYHILMAKTYRSRKLLSGGGELFVNQMGNIYTVDVWDWMAAAYEDPMYHASYKTLEEAKADADSWEPWPGTDILSSPRHLVD